MAEPRPPRDVELPDPLVDLVVDYDEALAAGHATPVTEAIDPTTSRALPEPLRGAVECLDLLDRERRRRKQSERAAPDDDVDTVADQDSSESWGFFSGPATSRFGRFEIVRELGQGGQAVVFLARDPALNRLVALKMPRPDVLTTPSMRRRFLREGKAAAQLSHPNVVTVFEAGEIEPICYLTQAYCPGINLSEWLRLHPTVSPLVAARLVADLADGIAHAHERGVWHRDLKPSNVLLEVRPQSADQITVGTSDAAATLDFVPKLTDFGLAKTLEPDGDETATGAVIGTASYMAPEQASGAADAVTPAVDIYGLGAILYELLTGQVIFRGSSHGATLRLVLDAEPVRPRVLRPDVPRDLEAICLRCLEKQPQKRYASAKMLAEDLQRFLHGEPTLARPIRTRERVLKWARRRPTAAALVAVSALAVLLLMTSSTWYSIRLSRALSASQASESRLREVLYSAEVARAHQTWQRLNSPEALQILRSLRPEAGQADLRGFAWRHLWTMTHDYQADLVGHHGDVYCVAASPDGNYWATAGKDRSARIWSREGQLRHVLLGHLDEVDYVCFSPDSHTLASSGDDGTIRFWRVDNGALLRTLSGHQRQVSMVTYSRDGSCLASSSHDGTIRLWRAADGELIWSHKIGDLSIHSVAFSPDGARLVTASEDDFVRVWEISETAPTLLLEFTAEVEARCVDYVEDGKSLLLGLINGAQELFDAETGSHVADLSSPFLSSVMAQGVDPARGLAAAVSADGTATVTHVGQRALLRTFQGQAERLWGVAFAPHDPVLATASADGTVRLWHFDDRLRVPQAAGLQWVSAADFQPQSLDLSTDGRIAAVGYREGLLAIHDARTWDVVRQLPPHAGHVIHTRFTRDARWLASISSDGNVRVTDTASGELLFERTWSGDPDVAMFAPDNRWLALGGYAGWLEVLDTTTWTRRHRVELPVAVNRLALSGDGRTLVSPRGYMLHAWDTATWKPAFTLALPGRSFYDATYSPDGKLLVTAESPRTVGLRHPRTGALISTLTAREDVERVAISPDNLTLACLENQHHRVRLWDLRTGHEMISLDAPESAPIVREIAFSQQGDSLLGLVARRDLPTYLVRWRADLDATSVQDDFQRKRRP